MNKDFTQPQADLSGIEIWTGSPADSWGKIAVESLPAGIEGGPKTALVVTTNPDNPSAPDGSRFCPSITVPTPAPVRPSAGKTAVYTLRFYNPTDGKYRTDFHFGGSWDSNAAILVLEADAIDAMLASGPTKVGSYTPKAWQELKVEFDCAAKTYSVFLNGKQIANSLPWNDPKLDSVASLQIVAGAMPVDQPSTPVLYLASLTISQK